MINPTTEMQTEPERLYGTKEQYCDRAIFIDNTLNYSYDDMNDDNEKFQVTYNSPDPQSLELGIGKESLDSFCYLVYNGDDLVRRRGINFTSFPLVEKETACDELETLNIYNNLQNFRTPQFQTNDIQSFGSIIDQNQPERNKLINTNIVFRDSTECAIRLVELENELLIDSCNCPTIEMTLKTDEVPEVNPSAQNPDTPDLIPIVQT